MLFLVFWFVGSKVGLMELPVPEVRISAQKCGRRLQEPRLHQQKCFLIPVSAQRLEGTSPSPTWPLRVPTPSESWTRLCLLVTQSATSCDQLAKAQVYCYGFEHTVFGELTVLHTKRTETFPQKWFALAAATGCSVLSWL